MKWQTDTWSVLYGRLLHINGRVFGVISFVTYSLLYLLIVPFFAIAAKKKIAARVVSGWQPWQLRSDTLADVKKQY